MDVKVRDFAGSDENTQKLLDEANTWHSAGEYLSDGGGPSPDRDSDREKAR